MRSTCFLLIFFIARLCAAQEYNDITLHGAAFLSVDAYSSSSEDTLWKPRLPALSGRGILRANLSLYNVIEAPFELYVSTAGSGFQQPFNQFGISPRYDWLTVHAGYFSTKNSDLTFGDVRILGGGIEINSADFHLSALYGIGRQARLPDFASQFAGEYKRTMSALRIGYGDENDWNVHVNVVQALDNQNTLPKTLTPFPTENLATPISFGLPFSDFLHVRGEIGASVFSNNTTAPEISDTTFKFPTFLFTPRYSTQIDGGGKLSFIIFPSKNWAVKLDAQWIGPGYISQGYVQLQNDIFETVIAPSVRLYDNKLLLRSSFGMRYNNLRNNRLAVTRRMVGSFLASAQISPALSVDAQYSNYGIRSSHINDTLRQQNIFQMISLSPRWTFSAFGANQSVGLSYSFQDVDDKNLFTSVSTLSTTHLGSIIHTLTIESTLNFSTSAFYTSIVTPALTTKVMNVSETLSDIYYDGKLSVALTGGYSFVQTFGQDNQFIGRITASYQIMSKGTLVLTVNSNNYDYAQAAAGNASFREFQASLLYQLTF
ncbi:MAG: hypothetical protein IPM69_07890 [Ignavibacteria bacterium]|nr:hypothetical protein [Ignavibacteria bacterium]